MIVADTNLIAYLLIPGERSSHARRILLRDPAWAAPMLWRSEFCSVLARYMRQALLDVNTARDLYRQAHAVVQGREYTVEPEDVLGLAARSGCSAYDCEFVSLAAKFGVPLITSDRAVLQAFSDIAVAPEAWLST